MFNDRNVTNSDQRLLFVTATPPVSALLMVRPRTGQLTVRLLPWDTGISVNAARDASPPTTCRWITNDDLRLRWRRRAATVIDGF